MTVLKHPLYSPDLAPNDFFLFPKIEEILKGRHFDDIDNIRCIMTATLEVIPQNEFQNCFEEWTSTGFDEQLSKGSNLMATGVKFKTKICSTHISG
jgi:hypothetical protein